jgi:hypothetical protein
MSCSVDGRITLGCILQEVESGGMDWIDLAQYRARFRSECSNEPSEFHKMRGVS